MENIDRFGRRITYLRISVTDRCNLRCIYCMPASGVPWRPHAEILRYEEIVRIARAAAGIGIRKVRLTGGEPLVREGIVELVRELHRIPGIDEIVMTTNGALLSRYAKALAAAGLARVNISLDSLRADRFRKITRVGNLEETLAGIRAAQEMGLSPVKLNTVVMRGINDDEIADLAGKSLEGLTVRFIEWMPIGGVPAGFAGKFVPGDEIKARIEERFGPLVEVRAEGPARVYRIPGAAGEIGLITALSAPFCDRCNRMRITADGKLRPCLLSPVEIDLKGPLRTGADEEELSELLKEGIKRKPYAHGMVRDFPRDRAMSEIGG